MTKQRAPFLPLTGQIAASELIRTKGLEECTQMTTFQDLAT